MCKRIISVGSYVVYGLLPREQAMSEKIDKHKIEELKKMVKEKDPKQPIEQLLTVFCERHGLTMGTCRYYYNTLVDRGEIKEK